MPVFLVPDAGQSNYGIAICDRCRMKRFSTQLRRDPNYPGLRVCDPGQVQDGCLDQYDPWRLPARQTELINLPFVRPDVPLGTGLCGPSYDTTFWFWVGPLGSGLMLATAPSGGGYDSGTWILASGIDPEGTVDNAQCNIPFPHTYDP